MEHKKAIAILIRLLDKRALDAEEKQAMLTAIGVLGWTSLSQSRIKSLKVKREKSVEWESRIISRRVKKNAKGKYPM